MSHVDEEKTKQLLRSAGEDIAEVLRSQERRSSDGEHQLCTMTLLLADKG